MSSEAQKYARSLLQRRHGNLARHDEYDHALDQLLKEIEELEQKLADARKAAESLAMEVGNLQAQLSQADRVIEHMRGAQA